MTCACGTTECTSIRLYHGSDAIIEHPDVALNTGFADLGRGFYLTDDHDAAIGRARSRARRMGLREGAVSVFELEASTIPWVVWGTEDAAWLEATQGSPFGLCFDDDPAGIAAWATYIGDCRQGRSEVPGLGEPAIVRAWIATEEIEMVYAGFATAGELAELMDPAELVVQYCLRDQAVLDQALTFVGSERVDL